MKKSYIPKQRGYYKIDLPVRQYVTFNEATYPYTFEVSGLCFLLCKGHHVFDQKTEKSLVD